MYLSHLKKLVLVFLQVSLSCDPLAMTSQDFLFICIDEVCMINRTIHFNKNLFFPQNYGYNDGLYTFRCAELIAIAVSNQMEEVSLSNVHGTF